MTIPQLICLNVSRVVPSKSKGNNTKFLYIWDVSSNPDIPELVYPIESCSKAAGWLQTQAIAEHYSTKLSQEDNIVPWQKRSGRSVFSLQDLLVGEFTRVMTLV